MMTYFHRLPFNKKVFWTGAVLVVLAVAWRAIFLWISVDRICVSGDEAIMGLQGMGLTQSADNPLFQKFLYYHLQLVLQVYIHMYKTRPMGLRYQIISI